MRIAFTVNGPGEYAGWLRPLLLALYARLPDLEATVFFVPDDFATGREAAVARQEFPRVRAVEPRDYVRFALGGSLRDGPLAVDRVQYLGGDLMHAARLARRLGGTATSYKFSRPRYKRLFARVFAVDARNREDLIGWRTPPERIAVVGNLAIDGALREAESADAITDATAADAVLFMPGSRRAEVANMVPFYFAVAVRLRSLDPGIPIVFGLSPFTLLDEVARALEKGGHPLAYAMKGRVVQRDGVAYLASEDGAHAFPAVYRTLRAATKARLAVTIPGTKTMELAALGVAAIVTVPFNAPELAVITGPLQYVERIPGIGIPLKRRLALQFSKRFSFFAQPNIDAERELMPELSGTLTPGYVARRVYESYLDRGWCRRVAGEERSLYAAHAGASRRMADALLAS
ncbi:MAG: hypothetical protein JO101_12960 [Candidatus Eremiobacteraeota bacterium]|nr:hypothetical protein [Candidatus Eremiobacteraeota bacterium]